MATSLSLLSGMALLVALLAALLTSSAAAAAPLSVSAQVDLSLGRHPVSQAIYGTNGAPEYMIQNNLTGSTRMGGGDPTTVYNWKIDADNAGADWYFQQRPRAPDGQTHSAVAFVNASITAGAIAFVDVSIIGYVAVNRSTDCYSFPVSRFPGQTRSSGNMGSGVYPNGSTVASIHGAQLGCYITSGPKDIVAFVAFLIEQFGQEVVERYVVVQFDNEPEWWSAQHQDVHPAPYTYDEVWNKMYAHAVALKAAYPKVKISGFVMGGWPGMWCSGVDGASLTNSCPCNDQSPPTHCQDWRAHNKTYLWPYLLQRINAHKVQTGVQLVDYMDHHWYPMFNDMRDDSTALAQAQLLNETRNLYDPTFIDPTGLLDPTTGSTKSAPAIIPRVQQWLKEYAPDCQLGVAITEFNFGDDSISTTALSMAEAYAIMGREGLFASHRFANTRPTSAPFQSYLLYRDYDGRGSKVVGDSVHAQAQADLNSVTAYAQHDSSSHTLYVLLFNKEGADEAVVAVSVAHVTVGAGGGSGTLYQFQAQHAQKVQLAAAGEVKMTAGSGSTGSFNVTLPVRTASLIVFKAVSEAQAAVEEKRAVALQ